MPAAALRLPARKAAAAAAIVAALGYTLLAGFAVPAQRTFYMVTVVALALWCGRIASPSRTLALALAVVVVGRSVGAARARPVAVVRRGGAHLLRGFRRITRLMQWGRMQWAITIGLAPAALLLFGQVSVAGPLANAVAIPLVSVVVTPLALLAAVLPFEFLLTPGGVAGRMAAGVPRMVRGAAGRVVAAARAAALGRAARDGRRRLAARAARRALARPAGSR